MKTFFLVLTAAFALALSACARGPVLPPPLAYDFGPPPDSPGANAIPLSLELRLPPWLDTPAVHYRLAYQDGAQLAAYAQTRWVAPAGQLLSLRLRQHLAARIGAPCQLRIEVDEFVQVFDGPAESRGMLQGRMTLADKQRKLLAERSFSVATPAASADGRGGVGALIQSADAAARGAAQWLSGLDREGRLGACR